MRTTIKNIQKIMMMTFIFVLMFLFIAGQVLFKATEKSPNDQSKDSIKNSVNDLLYVEKNLFLATDKPLVDAPVAYLINGTTGQVLFDDDGDYQMDILSVSKILSAYVILDEMRKHPEKYNWDTRMMASGNIVKLSANPDFSNIELQEYAEYTLKELFEAMMMKSSNSATMLIGKVMFGGEKQFVEMARKKAADLNLNNTIIKTSTGLNKTDLAPYGYKDIEEGNNRMTAEDVSFLTMKIIEDYPEILDVTSKPSSKFGTLTDEVIEYDNTNWLLPGFEYGYEGVNGFKTGADLKEYTSNIVFTAERNGVRLIGVILGAQNVSVRSAGAENLLEYGFKLLKHKAFITPDSVLFEDGTVQTKYASRRKLPVKVAEDFILSTSYGDLKPEYIFVPTNKKYNAKYDAFNGPIRKGEVLGYITVDYSDLAFLTNGTQQHYGVNVIAAQDIGNGFFLFNCIEWLTDNIRNLFIS